MEIYWRDNFLCPTEEEYRLMISRKTGQKILKSRLLLLCTRHGLGSREQALARIDDDSVFQGLVDAAGAPRVTVLPPRLIHDQ